MKTFLLPVVVAIAALAIAAEHAAACQQCSEDYIGGQQKHWFGSTGPPHPYECGPAGCHTDQQSYFCDTHGHNACGGGFAMSVNSIQSAVENHDLLMLRAYSLTLPRIVTFNAKRSAYQVLNCSGEVVVNVPTTQNIRFTVP